MTKQNYLFHFKISPKFNDYINYLMEKLNFKSNCRLIDYILEVSSANIRNIKILSGIMNLNMSLSTMKILKESINT
ncbi:MAG TPA: hypothetical protein P5322_11920 [Spirochaetota bacterium]|nr:hypothetical protein [Spirochaetota bacterium]